MIRHPSTLSPLLVAALLFLAPLPFGSVGPGFRVVLFCGIALAFLWTSWTRSDAQIWLHAKAPAMLVMMLAALALLQSLWWPSQLASVVSPAHAEIAASVSAGESSVWVPMSFAPQVSRRAAVGWAMASLALLLGAALRSRRDRLIVFGALVAAAVFQAVYGAPHVLGDQDLIWAQAMPAAQGRLRGTFVNPNHTAFFLGLALPVAMAWGWLTATKFKDGDYHRLGVLAVGAPWLVWLVLAGAVVLTQSRGGTLVMLSVLVLQLSLVLGRKGGNARIAALVTVLIVVGAAVFAAQGAGGDLMLRFEDAKTAASPGGARLLVYAASIGIWTKFPVLGSGLGSFRQTFSALAPAETRGQWWNAHSDWIELLVTGGVVGLVLVGVALYLVIRRQLKRLRSTSRERRATALAVIGVLTAASLHSLVDFGLSMPANSFALAVIVGLGLSRRRTSMSRRPGGRRSLEAGNRDPAS